MGDFDWTPHVPAEMIADPTYQPVFQKTKDVQSLVENYTQLEKKIGGSVTFPSKEATQEEIAAFKGRAYEAGVFSAPPGSLEGYEIKKPDTLPEGVAWSPELSTKFATTLHKHGASKALSDDLLTLYGEAIFGAQASLKTSFDEGIKALKEEHGAHYEDRREMTKRLSAVIFKDPAEVEFFEQTGMGDHPAFLSVMMRLAPFVQQDSSFLKEVQYAGGAMSGDDVRSELARIMTDKSHPMHDGYWRNDPKVKAHVDDLYKKAYGTGTVDLTAGIVTEGSP